MVQPCAQGRRALIVDLARAPEWLTLFGGEVDDGGLELELQADGAQGKIDLVGLAGWEVAHRAGPGSIAAATVCRPVVAAENVNEARVAMSVASFAAAGRVGHFGQAPGGGREFGQEPKPLSGLQRLRRGLARGAWERWRGGCLAGQTRGRRGRSEQGR